MMKSLPTDQSKSTEQQVQRMMLDDITKCRVILQYHLTYHSPGMPSEGTSQSGRFWYDAKYTDGAIHAATGHAGTIIMTELDNSHGITMSVKYMVHTTEGIVRGQTSVTCHGSANMELLLETTPT